MYPNPWSGYDLPVNLCDYSLCSEARFKRTTHFIPFRGKIGGVRPRKQFMQSVTIATA